MPEPLVPSVVVRQCLDDPSEAAWNDFVRCFQPDIASAVCWVMRDYGRHDPALVDDLTQDTYVRLCSYDARLLSNIRSFDDRGMRAYIRRTAESTARDYFRGLYTQKRGSGQQSELPADVPAPAPKFELHALLGQIDNLVRQVTGSERDQTIFWLHHRQGYSAVEIAQLPHIHLSAKGVESCISRTLAAVVKLLQSQGKRNLPGFDVNEGGNQ